ncbi:DUF2357 domain-containing protein [Roseibacillus persicicus]|uniref:DUF2357 domain-containing protein n=1 Tax=Roseibacillus persicicus TaxID=454148 RepID=UPI00398B70BC
MSDGFDKLVIPLPEGGSLVLVEAGSEVSFGAEDCLTDGLPLGWLGRKAAETNLPPFALKERGREQVIRVLETVKYRWSLEGAGEVELTSSLQVKLADRWSLTRGKDGCLQEGAFQVVNQLGRASFAFRRGEEVLLDLPLEVISRKIDFDTEYRKMTEDVAAFCEQLLLSWAGATSLRFTSNPQERAKLLLEQYLFLKGFLTAERLVVLVEAIERNPHHELHREEEWKPAAMARGTDHLSHPMTMLRDWRVTGGRRVPGEVLEVRKRESRDTEPNRFVKFALEQFRELCRKVVDEFGGRLSLREEAEEMRARLDGILARRFFQELGRMGRLPLDNQTLQKREGYREVLRAWILTDAAASLNWEGNEECFEGGTRRVDQLYEYWIFIQLHQLLEGMEGMVRVKGEKTPEDFIQGTDNGQIEIRLKSGQSSRVAFCWKDLLRVDLHYERKFAGETGVAGQGSYSRNFRPDYTLSIYPAALNEGEAQTKGQVAHLHFDAKYRVEQIAEIFGQVDHDENEEKRESKATATYKRADLLKMHTYNDALRDSIGSYVLYPGTEEPTKLPKFHEIAPGVGAYVMKPGNKVALDGLKGFLEEVFEHQADRFSQYRYLADTSHKTLESKPSVVEEGAGKYGIAKKNSDCVLLWMKKERQAVYRKAGFAYCWAIPENEDRNLNLNLSIEVGTEFVPYGGGPGGKKGWGWRAKVRKVEFVARERLENFLAEKGLSHLSPTSAKFYLLFHFEEASEFGELDLNGIVPAGGKEQYMVQRKRWSEIWGTGP